MNTVLPSQSDIRGSGYTAVSALRNSAGIDILVRSSNTVDEKSLPTAHADANDPKKNNDREMHAHDAKNWLASNSWVNTVNKRTLTLGPHWDQLQSALTTIIKQFTDQKVKKNVPRQIVFKLLGPEFVRVNYPQMKYEPHTLELPYMMPDVRDALLKEFKKELITVLARHLEKIKFNESPSYKAYLRAVKSAYDDGMGQEIQLMSKAAGRKFILEEQEKFGLGQRSEEEHEQVIIKVNEVQKLAAEKGKSELIGQGIAGLILGNTFETMADDFEQNVRQYGFKSPLDEDASELANATKTFPTDLLEYEDGAALITDAGTWSKKMHHNSGAVLRALVGHCVPISLRRFILKWRLFDSDDVETTFNVMKRNVAIQRLRDPTESALFTMISRTVPITFNSDLREYDNKIIREKAIVVLNQYFVTYGTQHASHVALLAPLLETFDRQPPKGPVMVSMFNRLLAVLPGNGPARAGSISVAREAVRHLKDDDEELYEFLQSLLKKAVDQQTELRSMNLTHRDIAEFREIGTFLIPWIDTCFIGYLRKAAAAFVWDQCFLTGWEGQFPIFVSDVLRASREDLLTIKNAYELQRVIIVAGRNVRTKHLRKYFKIRAKDKSQGNKSKRPQMDQFWTVPVLTRLNDAQPEKASLKRIQRLLAMVGGAADIRKEREEAEKLEVSKALENLNLAVEACEKGDSSTLSTLLVNNSVPSDAVTQKSQSLLYVAAYHGHPKCVQALLENKSSVDVGDHTVGTSPLVGAIIGANARIGAAWQGVSERYRFVIRYLLDAGADVNHKCTRTIIRPREMISAEEHDEIENHRRPMGKLAIIGAGSTPLHIATACALLPGTRYYGCPEILLLLRRHGADFHATNTENDTPASLVVDPSTPKAVKAALEIDLIDDKHVSLINDLRQACAMGETAKFMKVISMAQKQSSKAFRCIINGVGGLENGLAPKEMPPLQPWEIAAATPLALACAKGHVKIARALIEAGCDINCGMPGPTNPLVCAAQGLGKHGDPKNPPFTEIITRLIRAGARDNVRSAETGQSALHVVASRGIKPLYKLLVEDGNADELAKDFRGHVPKFLIAEATGEGAPRDKMHEVDVKDIPDMRENAREREKVPKLNFAKTDVGEDVVEVIFSQKLKVELVVPPRITGIDEAVGTRDLILNDPRNLDKIDKLRIEAVQKTKNSDDAENLVVTAIDTAILKKIPSLKDDRTAAFMKAKVKNNDGKPVLVKMRALTPEETPQIALERAQIIVERLNLPSSAASKLAKALVTYSKKKEKTEKNLQKGLLARAIMETGKSQNIIGKFVDVVFKEKNLAINLAPPRTVDGKGAIVTSVAAKGEAFKAGIIQNDFVQKIGKHVVSKRDMDDIQKIIRTEKRPTTVRFIRPGNEFDVEFNEGDVFDATLGQSPITTKPELVVLAVNGDSVAARCGVNRLDRILTINKTDVRALKYDAMIKEINIATRPMVIRFLRRVDKEQAKEFMKNITKDNAESSTDLEPPALPSKPSKSKNEYDVMFKKDKTLDMSFAKNPLGGGAYVIKVKKRGNASKQKIVVGDIVIGVIGKDVSNHPYELTKQMLKSEKRPMSIRLRKVSRLSRKPKNKTERDIILKHPISDCFEWIRPPHGGGAAISEIRAVGMADKLKVKVGDMLIGIEGIDLTSMTFVETVSLIANIEPPVTVRFKSPILLPKKKKKGEIDVIFKAGVTGIRHDHPLMGEGTVIFVVDQDSVGAKAGLVPGDKLIGVNGLSVENEPLKIVRKIIDKAKPPVTLRYQHSILKKLPRRPRKTEVDITFPKGESIGFGLQVDVEHHIECVVAEVVSGSHAEKQGVKEGYYIVGVGGKDVRASPYEEVIRLLNLSKEKNEATVIRFHTKPKTADIRSVLSSIREKMETEALSAQDVFREIDIDGGGTVSPDEFRQGITLFGFIATDPEFQALMDVLDANGDGEIELHEFEDAINNPEKAAEQADEELANVAETIQAAERGRIARKEFLEKKKNVTKIQALQRGKSARKQLNAKNASATKIQAQFRGMKSRQDLQKRIQGVAEDEIGAATKIQAIQRGKLDRQKVKGQREEEAAAVKVQAIVRGRNTRNTLKQAKESDDKVNEGRGGGVV